jgi:3-mercaptopyruvate sulfurtransferase SseA
MKFLKSSIHVPFLAVLLTLLPFSSAQPQENSSDVPVIVNTSWLKNNLTKPGLVILHVAGVRRDYENGHIPGARFLWPGHIIISTENESTVPAPVKDVTRLLRSLGVNNDSHVILCGIYGNIIPVSRIFVNLEHYGLKGRVSVLNGGFDAWKAAGLTISKVRQVHVKGIFTASINNNLVDGDFVNANLKDSRWSIIDARPKPQYDGTSGLPMAGHIPGAKNLPQTDLYDAKTFMFTDSGKIARLFKDLGIPQGSRPLFYCHTGNSASINYVAARSAGLDPVIYDGSMEEWASRNEWPVEKTISPGSDKPPLKKFSLTEVWRTDTVLMTPESVIYDEKRDILYVSNLNFEPRKKDGNGFISRMDKTGKIIDLKWIEGLSSPKGMGISGDILYAADVDEIVAMDITAGKTREKIPVPGAKMLNDITTSSNGDMYISDTDGGKIHKISAGLLTDWLSEGLNGPNGLLTDGERLLVASQGGKDFAAFDMKSKSRTRLADSIGRGDGIIFTGIPGYYIVSDWEGEIFVVNPDNTKVSLLRTKELGSNTADICYLPEQKLLLVPTFFKNCVVAYRVEVK